MTKIACCFDSDFFLLSPLSYTSIPSFRMYVMTTPVMSAQTSKICVMTVLVVPSQPSRILVMKEWKEFWQNFLYVIIIYLKNLNFLCLFITLIEF